MWVSFAQLDGISLISWFFEHFCFASRDALVFQTVAIFQSSRANKAHIETLTVSSVLLADHCATSAGVLQARRSASMLLLHLHRPLMLVDDIHLCIVASSMEKFSLAASHMVFAANINGSSSLSCVTLTHISELSAIALCTDCSYV